MHHTKDYVEILRNCLHKASSERNAAKVVYYNQLITRELTASHSYDTFISTWAGQQWLQANQETIDYIRQTQSKRFGLKWI